MESLPFESMEKSQEAFFVADRKWNLVFVNRRTELYWNRNREELIGKNLWDELPQLKQSLAHKLLVKAAKEKKPVEFDALSPVLEKWIHITGTPVEGGYSVSYHVIAAKERLNDELRGLIRKK